MRLNCAKANAAYYNRQLQRKETAKMSEFSLDDILDKYSHKDGTSPKTDADDILSDILGESTSPKYNTGTAGRSEDPYLEVFGKTGADSGENKKRREELEAKKLEAEKRREEFEEKQRAAEEKKRRELAEKQRIAEERKRSELQAKRALEEKKRSELQAKRALEEKKREELDKTCSRRKEA